MASPSLPEFNTSLSYTQPYSTPHLTHTPLPKPGPNDLLVKIHAAAIDPVDIQLWGNPVIGWLAGKKEKGIGRDYSGEVVAIGDVLKKSGKWNVGDEVYGLCNRQTGEGTFAQYLNVVPGEPIAKKPKSLNHQEALPSHLSQSPNEKRRVVVSGASGGVGIWCVQLAKRLYDCHVIGICSGCNADFVEELGVDEVIDYGKEDVAKTLLEVRSEGKKYDLYIDCVGGTEMFNHWTELLHSYGAYITIVGDKTSRESIGGPVTYFTYPSQVLRHIRGYVIGPSYANVILYQKSELLEQVTAMVDAGKLKIVVQEVVKGVLSEEGHVEAWEKIKGCMIEGRVRGKIVVDIA